MSFNFNLHTGAFNSSKLAGATTALSTGLASYFPQKKTDESGATGPPYIGRTETLFGPLDGIKDATVLKTQEIYIQRCPTAKAIGPHGYAQFRRTSRPRITYTLARGPPSIANQNTGLKPRHRPRHHSLTSSQVRSAIEYRRKLRIKINHAATNAIQKSFRAKKILQRRLTQTQLAKLSRKTNRRWCSQTGKLHRTVFAHKRARISAKVP